MRSVLFVLLALLGPAAALASDFFIVWPGHPSAPAISPPREGPVVREWEVEINMRGIVANKAAVARINVRLPDGERTFVMRRFSDIAGFVLVGEDNFGIRPDARDEDISYNWYGEGGTEQMTIAVHQGVMSATVTGSRDVYSLIRREAAPVLQQIDVTRIPPPIELGRPTGNAKQTLLTWASLPQAKSAIDTVDILVVHTPAALAQAGSMADLNARVAESFVQVENALVTSGMDSVRVRNVITGGDLSLEVPYNEVPGNTCTGPDVNVCRWVGHRIWVRTDATVAAQRDAYGADLVVMLVADQVGPVGVAYVQNFNCGVFEEYEDTPGCDIGAAYAPFAFSVVSLPHTTSYLVFAHEVGHQFGMQHHSALGVTPAYPWSYAKIRSNNSAETIVGGAGLARSMQYSNPNVPFIGTTETSGETLRFNARTGVCLAPTMSGFRTPGQLFRLFADGFEEQLVPLVGC